jgi:hypothetical protein
MRPFWDAAESEISTLPNATVRVSWPTKEAGAYSDLVIEGHGLIQKIRVPLPLPADATVYAPWPQGQASLLSGQLLSGAELVGRLECPVHVCSRELNVRPVERCTAELRIGFEKTSAHLRRLIAYDQNGNLRSFFSSERPELVTHVPHCCLDGEPLFTLDLYLDKDWTPDGWSMQVPAGIKVIQVHGEDGSRWGKLTLGEECGQLITLPLSGLRQVKSAAKSRVWESSDSAVGDARSAWGCKGDNKWQVQLRDGSARQTTSTDDYKLKPLPLRACYISHHDNSETKPATECKKGPEAEQWLKNYPHVGCSPTLSKLCP